MSSRLQLTPAQCGQLAEALRALSHMTETTGVSIGHSGRSISINDIEISVRWDPETSEYLIDDWLGN